jgi:hypothetical protein
MVSYDARCSEERCSERVMQRGSEQLSDIRSSGQPINPSLHCDTATLQHCDTATLHCDTATL